MRVAQAIELDEQTRSELATLSKGRRVEARVQQRASVVLLAAQGWTNKDIAAEVKLDRRQVAMWRERFMEGGVQALLVDASRSGRTPTVTPEVESDIVRTTLYVQPPAATHWSTRSLAAHLGMSATTIRRVWQRNGIQPQLFAPASVQPEASPRYAQALVDVVGLYMNPRERVLVISHASQAPSPNPSGSPAGGAKVHHLERWRDQTNALMSAIRKLELDVISQCEDRHRHDDWLRFLRRVDRKAPGDLQLHLVVQNEATHKRPKVQAWLARHPRLGVHSTPAGDEWLDSVRRLLCEMLTHGLQPGSFSHVAELQRSIATALLQSSTPPRPFEWSLSALDPALETVQIDPIGVSVEPSVISTELLGANDG